MSLHDQVTLTSYVPYKWDENLNLRDKDFQVPARMRIPLEACQKLGIHLEWDGSKSQGLRILSRSGAELGLVETFGNVAWLINLQDDLSAIAENPHRYGAI